MISTIAICVAVDQFGGFAKDNEIPWNIPEDFRHFMTTTNKSWCITGKNSYLEMVDMKKRKQGAIYSPNVPVLSNRELYVVSSTLDPDEHNDCHIIRPDQIDDTLDELREKQQTRPLFVLGGQELFECMLDQVKEVIVTHIPENFECDRFFPMDRLAAEYTPYQNDILETVKYGTTARITKYVRNQ